jgi:hypothetical protein
MKKVVIPGIVSAIGMIAVAIAAGYLLNALFPSVKTEYENTHLFRPWDDPLMYLYFIEPFILSIGFAWVWEKVKTLFQGSLMQKSFNFALIYWLVSAIPGMLMSVSSFKISLLMTLTWTISSFLQAWIASMIIVRMNK